MSLGEYETTHFTAREMRRMLEINELRLAVQENLRAAAADVLQVFHGRAAAPDTWSSSGACLGARGAASLSGRSSAYA